MKKPFVLSILTLLISLLAVAPMAMAANLSTYGDATVVPTPSTPTPAPSQPYVWQLTSDVQGKGYAGLKLNGAGLTPNALTSLSADYLMTQGTFGGGSPRFSLEDASGNEAYIYWGWVGTGGTFTDPYGGLLWGTTGNVALTGPYSGPRVQSNGFGGYNSGYPSIDWATFLANAGGTSISHIYLDVDGGWLSTQVVDVAKLDVNGTDYTAPTPTPEPGTLLMLGSGVVGLIGVARRKLKV